MLNLMTSSDAGCPLKSSIKSCLCASHGASRQRERVKYCKNKVHTPSSLDSWYQKKVCSLAFVSVAGAGGRAI